MQPPGSVRRPGTVADLLAAGAALVLVGAAALVGWWLHRAGRPVQAGAAPLFAVWGPHVGPGTPLAVLVAGLVVGYGPRLADRLPWRALLVAGYAAAVAWILSLALVDGWTTGVATRLTLDAEYLAEVPGVTDIPTMLAGFTGRILDFRPDSWTTHVAGHPPGALLVFTCLERVGLGGGAWAATVCVLAGAATVVAVPVTLRALGDEPAARVVLPFLVLLPGAVWLGVCADALFAGVTASGIALLALAGRTGVAKADGARAADPGAVPGRTARGGAWAGRGSERDGGRAGVLALVAGLLLGFGLFLSYGLVLLAPLALVAVALSRRRWPLVPAALGVAVVVAAFAAADFWWFDGYRLVVERYHQGIASDRAYGYWVWANVAALVLAAGPVVGPVLRRAVAALRPSAAPRPLSVGRPDGPADEPPVRWRGRWTAPVALTLTAVLVIAAADVSGLSKAEVERIWLPFTVWLVTGAALLPAGPRRWWLAGQAGTALAVNHLVWTVW